MVEKHTEGQLHWAMRVCWPAAVNLGFLNCRSKAFTDNEIVEDAAVAAAFAAEASAKEAARCDNAGTEAIKVGRCLDGSGCAIKICGNDKGTTPRLNVTCKKPQNFLVVVTQLSPRDEVGAANRDGGRTSPRYTRTHGATRQDAESIRHRR